MANYHACMRNVSKSKGMNAIEAAAYRSGGKLEYSSVDPETGLVTKKVFDYSKKGGIAYSQIHGPANLAEWVFNRQQLWQAVHNNETRKNARFAKDCEFSLPVELTLEQNIDLAKDFVESFFISRDLIVDVNIHNDNPDNPHMHLLVAPRRLEKVNNEEGIWDSEYKFRDLKDSDIESKSFLYMLRYEWALTCNKHLALAGHTAQVSSQSFADMGIDLRPTEHEGDSRFRKNSEIRQKNKEIIQANYEELLAKPELIIDCLDISRPVYTKEVIKEALEVRLIKNSIALVGEKAATTRREQTKQNSLSAAKHLTNKKRASLFNQVMGSDKIVMVNAEDIKGNALYTKKERYELEVHFREHMQTMNNSEKHSHDISALLPSIAKDFALNQEQQTAIKKIFSASDITSLVGLPGTGKTKTCAAIAALYKKLGYNVIGTAPTNKAALELSNSLGMEVVNSTLLRYNWLKSRGIKPKFNLTTDYYKKKDYQIKMPAMEGRSVLLIDEASMLDLPTCSYLVDEAKLSGAKVLMIGDMNQNPAIGIASGFRNVTRLGGGGELFDVQRHQAEDLSQQSLMQEATKAMAEYKIGRAIEIYEQLGMIELCETEEEMRQNMVDDYVADVIKNSKSGVGNKCSWDIGAVTNEKVNYFNREVRERLKNAGVIRGKEYMFTSGGEQDSIAVPLMKGDRIILGSNVKYFNGYGGVSNRETGTITRIIKGEGEISIFNSATRDRGVFEVEIERGGEKHYVKIMTGGKYPAKFQHGYALTSHAWQGVSKDIQVPIEAGGSYENYFVLFTRFVNQMKLYVAKSTLEDVVYKTKDLDVKRAKELYQLECYKSELGERVEAESWRVGLRLLLSRRANLSGALDYEYNSKEGGGNLGIVEGYLRACDSMRELEKKRKGLEYQLNEQTSQRGLCRVLTNLFNVEAPSKIKLELYRLRYAIVEHGGQKNSYVQGVVDSIYASGERARQPRGKAVNWLELPDNKQYKLLAMSLPLRVKEQIRELYKGLDAKRLLREQAANQIVRNYFTLDEVSGLTAGELLVQAGRNFETVLRHSNISSSEGNEKIYFSDIEQKAHYSEGYVRLLYVLKDISQENSRDLQSLGASQILELAKLADNLQISLVDIKGASKEIKAKIEHMQAERSQSDSLHMVDKSFLDKEFDHYLGQLYKDSASSVKQRWNELVAEEAFLGGEEQESKQMQILLSKVEGKPHLLGSLKGIGFGGWLSLDVQRRIAKEQSHNLASQLLKYERAKRVVSSSLKEDYAKRQEIKALEGQEAKLKGQLLSGRAVNLLSMLQATGIGDLLKGEGQTQVKFDLARGELWQLARGDILKGELASYEHSLLKEHKSAKLSEKSANLASSKFAELQEEGGENKSTNFFSLSAEHLPISKPFYSDNDLDRALLTELGKRGDIPEGAKLEDIYGKDALLLRHKLIAQADLRLASLADEYGRRVYLPAERLDLERHFSKQLGKLAASKEHQIKIEALPAGFTDEQAAAIKGALASSNAVMLNGLPGTGKTYVAQEIVRQLEANGYKVIGAAQANKAASHLGSEAGIESRNLTLHRLDWQQKKGWLGEFELEVDYHKQEQYRHDTALDSKTAIIVDEFSMLDLPTCGYLVDEVSKSGAKLIGIGDLNQQPAIGYLGGMRQMQSVLPVYNLSKVQRQRHINEETQGARRNISQNMGTYNLLPALSGMEQEGMLIKGNNEHETRQQLLEDYSQDISRAVSGCSELHSDEFFAKSREILSSHIIGVHTNQLAATMNESARQKLKLIGLLDDVLEQNIKFGNYEISLAKGERIMFTGNINCQVVGGNAEDKQKVANRDMAIITDILPASEETKGEQQIIALLDSGKKIIINSGEDSKARIAYAYALTSHILQGLSAQRVYIPFESQFNYETFNVLVTRYIEQCRVYLAKETMQEIIYRGNFKEHELAMQTHQLEVYNYQREKIGRDKAGNPLYKQVRKQQDCYHLGMMLAISRFSNHALSSEVQQLHAASAEGQPASAPDILLQSKMSGLYKALRDEASEDITKTAAKWRPLEAALAAAGKAILSSKEQHIAAKIDNIRQQKTAATQEIVDYSTLSNKEIIAEYVDSRQITREMRQDLDNYCRKFEGQEFSQYLRQSIASRYDLIPPRVIRIKPYSLIEGIYHKKENKELAAQLGGNRLFQEREFSKLTSKEQSAIIAELMPKDGLTQIFSKHSANRLARDIRENVAKEILNRVGNDKFRYLLQSYNINYYTLLKHASKAPEKYYFSENIKSSSLARGAQGQRYLGAIKTITLPLIANRFIKDLTNEALKEKSLKQLTSGEFELFAKILRQTGEYSQNLRGVIASKSLEGQELEKQGQIKALELRDAEFTRGRLLPQIVANKLDIKLEAAADILSGREKLSTIEQKQVAFISKQIAKYQQLGKQIEQEGNQMDKIEQIKALEREIANCYSQLPSGQEQKVMDNLKAIIEDAEMNNMAKSLAVSHLLEGNEFRALENNYYSAISSELVLSGALEAAGDNGGKGKRRDQARGRGRARDAFAGKLQPAIIAKIFLDNAALLNPNDKPYIKGDRGVCGSININLANGLWHRFSSGIGGNITRLVEQARNISSSEAKEYIEGYIAKYSSQLVALKEELKIESVSGVGSNNSTNNSDISNSNNDSKRYIIARVAPRVISKQELSTLMSRGNITGSCTALYPYRNIDGQLIGYTARFEHEGGKQILPLAYAKSSISNNGNWVFKGFSDGEYKPLYGLEKLSANQRPVLIVEGEKAADYASAAYSQIGDERLQVISWLGGSSSAAKARWSLLAGREVVIWPDNDEAGIKAAIKIRQAISAANGLPGLVRIVDTAKLGLPTGWDLADEPASSLSSNISRAKITKIIQQSLADIRADINLKGEKIAKISAMVSAEHDKMRKLSNEKLSQELATDKAGNIGGLFSGFDNSFDISRYNCANLIDIKGQTKASLDTLLYKQASEGLKEIAANKNEALQKLYAKRLKRELGIIASNGLSSNFLMASNIKRFCCANNIATGMGRGSSSCSLVAYIVGIHGVDPIKHELPFERFITSKASSLPDFDIDVAASRQKEVIGFMLANYQSSARIMTSDGKLHNSAIMMVSKKQVEQHGLEVRYGDNGERIINITAKESDKLNLHKYDILPLVMLDKISLIESKIALNHNELIDWSDKERGDVLHDFASFDLIRKKDVADIFQLGGERASKKIATMLNLSCDNFADLVNLQAEIRPGAKSNELTVKFSDPKEVLKVSNGRVLFEEQIMQLGSEYLGLSGDEANSMMRGFAKGKENQLVLNRAAFIQQGIKAGVLEQKQLGYLYDMLGRGRGYNYNKGHSVAYSMLTFKTLYLKAHYRAEFEQVMQNKVLANPKLADNIVMEVARNLQTQTNNSEFRGHKHLPRGSSIYQELLLSSLRQKITDAPELIPVMADSLIGGDMKEQAVTLELLYNKQMAGLNDIKGHFAADIMLLASANPELVFSEVEQGELFSLVKQRAGFSEVGAKGFDYKTALSQANKVIKALSQEELSTYQQDKKGQIKAQQLESLSKQMQEAKATLSRAKELNGLITAIASKDELNISREKVSSFSHLLLNANKGRINELANNYHQALVIDYSNLAEKYLAKKLAAVKEIGGYAKYLATFNDIASNLQKDEYGLLNQDKKISLEQLVGSKEVAKIKEEAGLLVQTEIISEADLCKMLKADGILPKEHLLLLTSKQAQLKSINAHINANEQKLQDIAGFGQELERDGLARELFNIKQEDMPKAILGHIDSIWQESYASYYGPKAKEFEQQTAPGGADSKVVSGQIYQILQQELAWTTELEAKHPHLIASQKLAGGRYANFAAAMDKHKITPQKLANDYDVADKYDAFDDKTNLPDKSHQAFIAAIRAGDLTKASKNLNHITTLAIARHFEQGVKAIEQDGKFVDSKTTASSKTYSCDIMFMNAMLKEHNSYLKSSNTPETLAKKIAAFENGKKLLSFHQDDIKEIHSIGKEVDKVALIREFANMDEMSSMDYMRQLWHGHVSDYITDELKQFNKHHRENGIITDPVGYLKAKYSLCEKLDYKFGVELEYDNLGFGHIKEMAKQIHLEDEVLQKISQHHMVMSDANLGGSKLGASAKIQDASNIDALEKGLYKEVSLQLSNQLDKGLEHIKEHGHVDVHVENKPDNSRRFTDEYKYLSHYMNHDIYGKYLHDTDHQKSYKRQQESQLKEETKPKLEKDRNDFSMGGMEM